MMHLHSRVGRKSKRGAYLSHHNRAAEANCPDCVHPISAHAGGACQASRLDRRTMTFKVCGCTNAASAESVAKAS